MTNTREWDAINPNAPDAVARVATLLTRYFEPVPVAAPAETNYKWCVECEEFVTTRWQDESADKRSDWREVCPRCEAEGDDLKSDPPRCFDCGKICAHLEDDACPECCAAALEDAEEQAGVDNYLEKRGAL